MQYLGHVILGKGITPVPEKLDSIQLMPVTIASSYLDLLIWLGPLMLLPERG